MAVQHCSDDFRAKSVGRREYALLRILRIPAVHEISLALDVIPILYFGGFVQDLPVSYQDRVQAMIDESKHRLKVNLNDLRTFEEMEAARA